MASRSRSGGAGRSSVPAGFIRGLSALPIRVQLVLLVLAVGLPSLAVIGYGAWAGSQHDLDVAAQTSASIARVTAANTERFLARGQRTLATLADRPQVRAVDARTCDAFLAEVPRYEPQYANLGLIDLGGHVICSAVVQPGGQPADVSGSTWFRAVRDRAAFVVGDPFIGPITHKWVSVLAYPVLGTGGAVAGYLALPIDLAAFAGLATDAELPAGSVVSIIDADGVIVARSIDAQRWVGQNVKGVMPMPDGSGRTGVGRGVDGVERVYASAIVVPLGWFVVAGIPTATATASARELLARTLPGIVVVIALAGLLALLIGRSIMGPIHALAAATESRSVSDGSAIVPVAGPAEIADVARRFNAMVQARQIAIEDRILAERRFRALVEQLPAMVYVDQIHEAEDGRELRIEPVYRSPRAVAMFGYPLDHWLSGGDPWTMATHPDDRAAVELALARSVADDVPFVHDYRVQTADGRWLWVRDEALTFRSADGTRLLQGLVNDVTERRELEDRLRQSGKMEAIGQLAGGIAHDFNNLLTAITGYSEMAHQSLPESSPARADLDQVIGAARRATQLVRQLLTFARREVVRPVAVEVDGAIQTLLPMLRRLLGEQVRLQTFLGAGDGRIRVDSSQLEQIVINLAINARDAMPAGGDLTIASGRAADSIWLEVADTGVGIAPEAREHIFTPFFTTRPVGEGTGLGLATVYGIVTAAGGSIEVESEPGRGARFRVSFPLTIDEAPVTPPPTPDPLVRGRGTVLLVEDEEAVRTLAGRVLKAAGYRVLVAANGSAALELADRHGASIDLLLTDVVMPGSSGPQLARTLSEGRPDLLVVFMSGYADRAGGGDVALDAPFLAKPFTSAALVHLVGSLLNGRPTHG